MTERLSHDYHNSSTISTKGTRTKTIARSNRNTSRIRISLPVCVSESSHQPTLSMRLQLRQTHVTKTFPMKFSFKTFRFSLHGRIFVYEQKCLLCQARCQPSLTLPQSLGHADVLNNRVNTRMFLAGEC